MHIHAFLAFVRTGCVGLSCLLGAAALPATTIDYFAVTGSPSWTDPGSGFEVRFSGLLTAGSQTMPGAVDTDFIELSSQGFVDGLGLFGGLTFNYNDVIENEVVQRRIATDFRFISQGGVFGFVGPAAEWRVFDPEFYSGGEKIFTDVLHSSTLPYLSFSYDSAADRGNAIWSATPFSATVPDAPSSGLLLLIGLGVCAGAAAVEHKRERVRG